MTMKLDDADFKKELNKYLEERKPQSFNSMIESMSWYTNMRKEFIKQLEEEKK